MRFLIILLLVSGLLWSHLLSAQNIGINETGANPHGSAILDVSSSNKGMLIPRLTTAQRTGIAAPANGLLVYDTNTSSFWFYDGGAWVELISGTINGNTLDEAYNEGGAGAGRIISADAGVVSVQGTDGIEVTGTFGSGAGIGSPGAGTRMFFSPRKAAFRAGHVSGNQWNGANVGNYSVALGNGTTASGLGSFATGQNSNASGDNSVALGNSTVSGNYSIAAGFSNGVSGEFSAVFGQENIVSGDNAVAMGYTNFVSGEAAVAMGETTSATGYAAVSIGNFTTASGYSSSAFGNTTTASGYASTAFGYLTTAESYLSVAYGRFNVGGGNGNSWQPQDAIFEIGIGTSVLNKDNAVTVLKNGNTGIGTATPSATLHVNGAVRIEDGTEASGRVLVSDNDGNAQWTESVGFSCIRTTPVTLSQGNDIVFNFAYHNRGNAYDLTTGEFTVPVEGLYQFHYIEHNNASANGNTGITIQKNSVFYKQLHTIQVVSSTRYANTITWTMELDTGDVVTIELLGVSRTISGSAGGSAIKSSLEGFLVR